MHTAWSVNDICAAVTAALDAPPTSNADAMCKKQTQKRQKRTITECHAGVVVTTGMPASNASNAHYATTTTTTTTATSAFNTGTALPPAYSLESFLLDIGDNTALPPACSLGNSLDIGNDAAPPPTDNLDLMALMLDDDEAFTMACRCMDAS